jgi:hypothetical protein
MGLKDLALIGGLCLAQHTLTIMGLKDLSLFRGLCLAQRTLATKSLKDLPLVGGLCLVQLTSTMKSSNYTNKPQEQMMCPIKDRVQGNHDNSQATNICSKVERGMDIMLPPIIYLEDFALREYWLMQ